MKITVGHKYIYSPAFLVGKTVILQCVTVTEWHSCHFKVIKSGSFGHYPVGSMVTMMKGGSHVNHYLRPLKPEPKGNELIKGMLHTLRTKP